MKKRGFTLAEVMIALALIGVIASLTIPTFIANSRNRANASKLAAIVASVENSLTSMIAAEAAHDLTETDFGASQSEANFGKYLKLAGSGSISGYYGAANPFVTLNRTTTNLTFTTAFKTKNGAILAYENTTDIAATDNHPGSIGRLTIDVNGTAKPNVWGRDVFLFRIGNDGLLYPAGGKTFKDMGDAAASRMACNPTGSKNEGCTARLIENGYEIDF